MRILKRKHAFDRNRHSRISTATNRWTYGSATRITLCHPMPIGEMGARRFEGFVVRPRGFPLLSFTPLHPK